MRCTGLRIGIVSSFLILSGCRTPRADDASRSLDVDDEGASCLFGASLTGMAKRAGLEVRSGRTVQAATSLEAPDITQKQIVEGMTALGFVAADIQAAVGTADDARVQQKVITNPASGARFYMYTFWQGEETNGFIMPRGATNVVAEVQGGRIVRCSVPAAGTAIAASGGACIFGATFAELESRGDSLQLSEPKSLRLNEPLSAKVREQIIVGVRHATDANVQSIESALEATDEGEVMSQVATDVSTGAKYDVFRYFAGDNPQGFIFKSQTTDLVAQISDDDIVRCEAFGVPAAPSGATAACLFGDGPRDILTAPGVFALGPQQTITRRTTAPSELMRGQLINGVRRMAPGERLPSYAKALASLDDGVFQRRTLAHTPSGREFTYVRYHKGGKPIGLVFKRGTTDLVATQSGDAIDLCLETP